MGCIYAFVDRNNRIFYIGQTGNLPQRVRGHRFEIDNGNHMWKYNKLRKEIRETGRNISSFIRVVEDNINRKDLDSREVYHIQRLRTEGLRLTNLTNGGKGSSNFLPSLQKRCAKSRKGRKHSEETKREISESHIGMVFSTAHRRNLSIARQKRVTTQETREKMSQASKGRINIGVFEVIDGNGHKYVTTQGLVKFCEEHNLTAANLHKVINGERKHHKGWTAKRLK